ncbi:GLPGLI family protein [Kaistella flava (ex Peng et al. 2021)]|uniref:GLPGLI family protein n=1 Tax=Kaistella flava (ex Peng et al. 2021) TaxID=2038776 RepID=A0A7M2YCR8_9FLAO|nr:GLPGLI family protein [Kaistella flava (ex Peng et al. 2021)]QOW11445.1 GLPGLI family protein [Kaistella flava (ex Peng et al. 2021)]
MKEKISGLFILLNLICFGQQSKQINITNVVCKYNVEFLKDTLNLESKTSEVMVLQIGDQVSLYKSQQKRATDSLRNLSLQNSFETAKTSGSLVVDFSKIPSVNLVHEVYKDHQEVQVFDKILKDQFVYAAYNKIDWKVGRAKKRIGDYECTEAKGIYNGRNYTAWFTSEIPIAEGPYTFKGLPGLILEVYDSEKYFFITLLSIQNLTEKIKPIDRVIKTNYADFIKKRKQVDENPVAEFQKISNTPLSKEIKDKLSENRKKKNNYLD